MGWERDVCLSATFNNVLQFKNYDSLREMFDELAEKSGLVWDGNYDWTGRIPVDVIASGMRR